MGAKRVPVARRPSLSPRPNHQAEPATRRRKPHLRAEQHERIRGSFQIRGVIVPLPRGNRDKDQYDQHHPNKLIADALAISVRTVEVHRARVFEKMNVKSAVELANLLRDAA